LQADKDAIAKLGAAQQTQTQQLSEQVPQLRNQIAGLQAEVAAGRELQTSQHQTELKRLSGALAAQKAAQKKAQAAHPNQPEDGDQAAAGSKGQATAAPATVGGHAYQHGKEVRAKPPPPGTDGGGGNLWGGQNGLPILTYTSSPSLPLPRGGGC
jgi:hypothetical protein